MRILVILALYALSFAMLWVGVDIAPQTGWPKNDVQLNGCALLLLGIVVKAAGHWQLLGLGRR